MGRVREVHREEGVDRVVVIVKALSDVEGSELVLDRVIILSSHALVLAWSIAVWFLAVVFALSVLGWWL